MAKKTRSTRRKTKTMKRCKAKTMKKPQRRTRLGLMKRKRFTRKVKRGGEWAYDEAQLHRAVAELDSVFEGKCNEDADDCTKLIKAFKEYIRIHYPDTYIFFYIQKNNIDTEIKETIIAYNKKNKFKIDGIIHDLIEKNKILTRFIEWFDKVMYNVDDDPMYNVDDDPSNSVFVDKRESLKLLIKNYKKVNQQLSQWEYKRTLPQRAQAPYAGVSFYPGDLIIEKNQIDKDKKIIINDLINEIKSIEIPESLRQSILTDKEKSELENSAPGQVSYEGGS